MFSFLFWLSKKNIKLFEPANIVKLDRISVAMMISFFSFHGRVEKDEQAL